MTKHSEVESIFRTLVAKSYEAKKRLQYEKGIEAGLLIAMQKLEADLKLETSRAYSLIHPLWQKQAHLVSKLEKDIIL